MEIKSSLGGVKYVNDVISVCPQQSNIILGCRYPVVCTQPFKQLAQLATHLEKLKPLMRPALATLIKEEVLISLPDRDEFEMVKLEEDSLLCGFNPWFRGLDWKHYRRYAPKSIPSTLAQVRNTF